MYSIQTCLFLAGGTCRWRCVHCHKSRIIERHKESGHQKIPLLHKASWMCASTTLRCPSEPNCSWWAPPSLRCPSQECHPSSGQHGSSEEGAPRRRDKRYQRAGRGCPCMWCQLSIRHITTFPPFCCVKHYTIKHWYFLFSWQGTFGINTVLAMYFDCTCICAILGQEKGDRFHCFRKTRAWVSKEECDSIQ